MAIASEMIDEAPAREPAVTAGHRHDVDYLRAVAVLAVVAFHWNFPFARGGFVGVDVFFVISGFLITRLIHREVMAGEFSFLNFYERRVRRILPALYTVMLATALVSAFVLLPNALEDFGRSVIATVTFTSNILFWQEAGYFDRPAQEKPLLHTWSLSVEEQFYVVLPLALLLLSKYATRRLWLPIAIIGFASFALSVRQTALSPAAAFFLSPGRAWEFLIGSVLAVGGIPSPRTRLVSRVAAWSGLCFIAASIVAFDQNAPFPGLYALVPCWGAALFMWAGERPGPPYRQGAVLSVAGLLGRISYSLYLWHWPVIVFAKKLSALPEIRLRYKIPLLAATILISYLSFRYVENPVRRRGMLRKSGTLFGAMAAASLILVALGGSAVFFSGFPQRVPEQVAQLAAFTRYPFAEAYRSGACLLDPTKTVKALSPECIGQVVGAKNVLVWGDSVAAHYVSGLRALGPPKNINVMQATMEGCVPLAGYGRSTGCADFNAGVLDIVKATPPDVVILAAAWLGARFTLGDDQMMSRLRGMVAAMKDLDVKVVVLGPPVNYDEPLPDILAKFALLRPLETFDSSAHIDVLLFAFDEQMRDGLAGAGGVLYVSVLKALCEDRSCPALTPAGVPLQWDRIHLTEAGSRYVAERLLPAIATLLKDHR